MEGFLDVLVESVAMMMMTHHVADVEKCLMTQYVVQTVLLIIICALHNIVLGLTQWKSLLVRAQLR